MRCEGGECYVFDGSRQPDPRVRGPEIYGGFLLRGDLTHLQREHAKRVINQFRVLLEVGWIRPYFGGEKKGRGSNPPTSFYKEVNR